MLRKTRNMLALLTVTLLLVGCQQAIQSKLVGDWKMEKAESLAKKVTSDTTEASPDMATPEMNLHFRSNGVLETVTQLGKIDSRKNGTWKLTQADSAGLTKIECRIEGVTTPTVVHWVNDSTIRLAPPNMSGQKMILKFTRMK